MAYTDVCGKKLREKLGAVLNESAVSHSPAILPSSQSFAKRQLEKMGWTEGTGLGKRRDGLVEHVKIKQREDEMGLGREKALAKEVANVWWRESVGGTLARLQKRKSADKLKKKKKDKKKDKSKDSKAEKMYTDEELFEATGGARFGMRAQRRAEGKWKRTESGNHLAEWEKKAKASMEWDGRGKAQPKIDTTKEQSDSGKKRKCITKADESQNEASISADKDFAGDEEETRPRKKSRKSDKKRNKIHEVSPPSSEDDVPDVGVDVEVKKKSKKDKKKKKKSSEQ
mmetsp:Transcript_21803/g.45843  ORF Transcript_21803/g.45843 Transcript_21803/m.45843 type:complete len:285 (-) Transcript_21803:170-1024(-)|eukprot:CAMPEP_0171352840 /NCGR_PEP_ID=MMETSP0878-20121228/42650_1 /TAXON_ID=67004 /ORGANISM="Thalassiosira weissflogii, Strain CCMP1336" /LENGTH=284 /DNA_ID=CAMNT_0011858603 /DNA_START=121 /DNA_END=975 /DNA_ORIENTATION=-